MSSTQLVHQEPVSVELSVMRDYQNEPVPVNPIPARSVENEATVLPPVDGGKAAWLFLTGCFLIETLLWGFPFSYGVLQEYYITHEPWNHDTRGVSAVGTTCSGVMYSAAPILFLFLQQYPHLRRKACVCGLFVVTGSLLLSSLCRTIPGLILTQGLLYAVGGCFLYYPMYFFIEEWFVARKGFAYGIMWAGSGMGGLLGPLTMGRLLTLYGFETMIRGWAIALLLISGPFLWYVRPRLPVPRSAAAAGRWRQGWDFLNTRAFWILEFGNIVQGLGYFIPTLYLPEYLSSVGYSPVVASALLSALNSALVPGVIFLSSLCDKTYVTNVIFISTFGSALSIFLCWGLSTSLPAITVFAISYGFFAGGWTSTYAGTVKSLMEMAPRSDPGSIVGLLSLGRGIGNVASGPISEFLLSQGTSTWGLGVKPGSLGYQSAYGVLIIFTGVTAVVSMCGWAAKVLKIF